MKKFKLAVGSSLAALALVVGLSVPAGAQPTETGPGNNTNETNITLGDCAGIITNTVVQASSNSASSDQSNQSNGGGVGNTGGTQSNTSTNSATSSQTAGVNFSPNCSQNTTHVTNVTQVTQAAAATSASSHKKSGYGAGGHRVAASQYPSGGVKAGAGGTTESVIAPIVGAIGSLAALSLGAFRLLKFEE